MNIREQIIECMQSTPSGKEFAFTASSQESRERFQSSVTDFLTAKKHREAENKCREVYFSMLDLHDKVPVLLPSIDRLNIDELYGTNISSGHRLHFPHQANVFLLGLFIYHNSELLRKQIDREVEETTIDIRRAPRYPPFRYSGGDKYGEFLYRWRLASLCHDIGTGIQLCMGDKNKIAETLRRFRFQKPIDSVKELHTFIDRNLLTELDEACGATRFSQYTQYQEAHPFPGGIHHDHGIMGALVFLQLVHGAYSIHSRNQISRNSDGAEVFWHPDILSHSIIQIAMAIGMHNLDKHPEALQSSSSTVKIFDMKRYPLAWLLKIADILQEWDKPNVGAEHTDQNVSTDLMLTFSNSKISVRNFPQDKREETSKLIRLFTCSDDIISFV